MTVTELVYHAETSYLLGDINTSEFLKDINLFLPIDVLYPTVIYKFTNSH